MSLEGGAHLARELSFPGQVLGGTATFAAFAAGALALAPPVLGRSYPGQWRGERLLIGVLTAVAAAGTLGRLAGLGGPSPAAGPALAMLVALGVTALTGGTLRAAAGASALVALAVGGHQSGPATTAMMSAHVLAGGLWAGLVAHLCLWIRTRPHLLRTAARQAGPALAGATALVITTGVVSAVRELPAPGLLTGTAYGRLVAAKVVLVLAAGGLGLWVRRQWRPGALVADLAVLSATALAGSVLVALPAALPFPPRPGPLVATGLVEGRTVTVVVNPGVPGNNHLLLLADQPPEVRLSGSTVAMRPQGAGAWGAPLVLPAGTSTLSLGDWAIPVRVRPAPEIDLRLVTPPPAAGAGAPECASRLLGQLAAVSDHNRQSRTFAVLDVRASASDSPSGAVMLPGCDDVAVGGQGDVRATGRLLGSHLAGRGSSSIAVVVDGTPRSEALAEGMLQAGRGDGSVRVVRPGTPLGDSDAVVVACGWADAAAVLEAARVEGGAVHRPLVLAPWLLRRDLLAPAAADPGLGQLVVAAATPPASAVAGRYLEVLDTLAPGAEPSSAGLAGYTDARAALAGSGRTAPPSGSPAPRTGIQLFSPVAMQILPPEIDSGHGRSGHARWLPSGNLVPVSSPLLA